MAVGYRNAAGVDFDDLFDLYSTGTSPAATGYRASNGVDLATRYAPISVGAKGPDVGYRLANGTDLSNLWAAKGTASYSLAGLNGKQVSATDQAATTQSQVLASASFSIRANGAWTVQGNNSRGAVAQPAPESGLWLPSGGSVGQYEGLIEVTAQSGSAGFNASGTSAWVNLASDIAGTLSLPSAAANNANLRSANATWRLRIRRASDGVVISDNTITGAISTQGYQ